MIRSIAAISSSTSANRLLPVTFGCFARPASFEWSRAAWFVSIHCDARNWKNFFRVFSTRSCWPPVLREKRRPGGAGESSSVVVRANALHTLRPIRDRTHPSEITRNLFRAATIWIAANFERAPNRRLTRES
jgi:hypothetical protein